MKIPSHKSAFILVEIMVVVAIIGILMAIAIPNFLQYRKDSLKSACIANLKKLEGAIEQLKLAGYDEITMADICEPLGRLKEEPRCPADDSEPYDISGDIPTCPNIEKFPDHKLVGN